MFNPLYDSIWLSKAADLELEFAPKGLLLEVVDIYGFYKYYCYYCNY